MTEQTKQHLGKTLWNIADELRGAMNADDFRDYMLSFLFLRYLSDHYEEAAEKELGKEYPNQQKIADCLSSLDGLIDAQSRKLETLREHKRGLMERLFPFIE